MDLKIISARVQALALDSDLLKNQKKKAELVEILVPYIKKIFDLVGKDKEDFLQDAIEIMFNCIKTYNPQKGAKFLTYYINIVRYKLADKEKEYLGKGVASGWTMNHREDANVFFENIEDLTDLESPNVDFDSLFTREETERIMGIFNENVLDVAIHSAIEEFNLTREEVSELFCIPQNWIKSSRRRISKIVAKIQDGQIDIKKY